jgi:hypothetical protein
MNAYWVSALALGFTPGQLLVIRAGNLSLEMLRRRTKASSPAGRLAHNQRNSRTCLHFGVMSDLLALRIASSRAQH